MPKSFTYTLILVLLLAWQLALSQVKNKRFETANKLYAKEEFNQALAIYFKLLEENPNDPKVLLKIGLCYLSSAPKFQSLTYLDRAYKINPKVDADIHYYLGLSNQLNFNFIKASKFFELYKERNKRMRDLCDHKIEECKRGDSLINKSVNAIVKVMEWPVNSVYEDYAPLLNDNEDLLVFTSARDSGFYDRRNKVLFEEIMIAHKKSDNTWTTPKKISPNVNKEYHDAATSLSRDGKILIIYYPDGNGDLYQSTYDGTDWSQPINMGEFINDPGSSETSGCFTPDGKKFYFASDRPTGYGGLDIYVAEINQFGEWGNAVNLGPQVNSAGDEDAPFLVHDSLMYFSSNGHPGLGNYDIFKAIRVKKKWQKPENLGYPINTAEYENFFHVAADGKHGYYTSVRQEGSGRSDICEFTWLEPEPIVAEIEKEKIEEPELIKPAEVSDAFVDPLISLQKDLGITTTLKGVVIDKNSSAPLRAQIILINNETNTVVSRVYSDAQTGAFNLDIPHGGNYGLNTSLNGYLFNSMNFEVPTFSEHVEIDTHILMVKAQSGSKVVLKNVFFDSGKSDLKNESIAELSRLIELLNANTSLRIQVNGHTDSAGDNATNKALSLRRAQAVVSFLQKNGIDISRLKAVGYGEERPLVSNDDETGGREINRRTEFEIISN